MARMHPLHDIVVPREIDAYVPAVVEIPRGSKLKYKLYDRGAALDVMRRALETYRARSGWKKP